MGGRVDVDLADRRTRTLINPGGTQIQRHTKNKTKNEHAVGATKPRSRTSLRVHRSAHVETTRGLAKNRGTKNSRRFVALTGNLRWLKVYVKKNTKTHTPQTDHRFWLENTDHQGRYSPDL